MTLKQKIHSGKTVIGTHISLGCFPIADAFAQIGYDFIWIDTEHTAVDYAELLRCVSIIKAHGTAVIVRAHVDEPGHVKRILEMGVDGVVFPNLETAEQIDDAIRSTYYPPRGYRGFGPLGAVRYGLDDANDYIKREDELCRFVQIERKAAVDNLDDILKVGGIDCFVFGPCDLSASLGIINQIYADENMKLIKKTIEKVSEAGGCTGVSLGTTVYEEQKIWTDLGCRMISAGADFDYAVQGALKNYRGMKRLAE
ncbi:MAG: aldolase [Clostridiales bacterium]|nr:aldolase [Clostridiales bacterium]